ncbi:hypothetical protein BX070DRAFT_237818 [Coemansia spiralis]|nr:hypothetical protein BX070DRAFT_237818 [Coemansia spiralis]
MPKHTHIELANETQPDSLYNVKSADGRIVLTIEGYVGKSSIDDSKGKDSKHISGSSHTGDSPYNSNSSKHPWDTIFHHQPAVTAQPARAIPQDLLLGSECGSAGQLSQCTTTSVDSNQDSYITKTLIHCHSLDIAKADPEESIVEEINTQGLFDGLDDLYNFSDSHSGKPRKATNEPANPASRVDNTDKCAPLHDQLEVMYSQEAAEIVHEFGDFSNAHNPFHSASAPQTQKTDGNTQQASVVDRVEVLSKNSLIDMSDDVAKEIVSRFGGFTAALQGCNLKAASRPSSANIGSSSTRLTIAANNNITNGSVSATSDDGSGDLADMSDADVRKIIGKFGGFSKLETSVQHATNSTDSLKTQSQEPCKKISQPPSPSPLSPPGIVAHTLSSSAGSGAQTSKSLFPSKSDVLSARRALRIDGSKGQVSGFNSPSKTPKLKQAPQSGSQNNHQQLAFKLPGLKRPSSRVHFTSPSKRLTISKDDGEDAASNMLTSKKPPARLLQFSKTFRSPARIANALPGASVQGRKLVNQHRPPPRLPPVTSTIPVEPNTTFQQLKSGDMVDSSECKPRQSIADYAHLIDVGNRNDMPSDILEISADSAKEYCFPEDNSSKSWGVSEARQLLISYGCTPSVVTEQWVQNHYRWIVWTCASYARRLSSKCEYFWSIKGIVDRLLHRYEREYAQGKRSALKMILEGDASPQQLMVLCLASIYPHGDSFRIEVTDGWYGINSTVDTVLAQAIRNGRLRIGDKIVCAGLRVDGLSEGVPPLSDTAKTALLSLTGNSVRRAHWHTKLGFQPKQMMYMSLSAVYELGGPIGATLDVIILRSYPMLYVETMATDQRVVRIEKEEQKIVSAFTEKRAMLLQEALEKRRSCSKYAKQGYTNAVLATTCTDGEELFNIVMHGNAEPAEAQQMLTDSQREALSRYAQERQAEDEAEAIEAVDKELPPRQVHTLFRLLVCDYPGHKYKSIEPNVGRTAVITFWRPQNILPADFCEGSRFLLSGLTISPDKGCQQALTNLKRQRLTKCLRLNFNQASRVKPMNADPEMIYRSEYYERRALHIDELRHLENSQEIDVVGKVESCDTNTPGQTTVLCLSSTDDNGDLYYATIEFSVATFGNINVSFGSQIMLRNCYFISYYNADKTTFRLKAEDVSELVL